ncbi:3-dehydroquinate dehydratase i [Trichoderma arundinaceum]|uniref:3-dehydroquinate dehydratase i n=1 Tax=Trichoderma arundinaceum TaxID=490622 RepID=A0A395NYL7_TRIAR|nr:3-dehydroquinate dehydratase i [Trichoderma arundinaceum]
MGVYSVLNLQVLTLWANYHYSSGNFGKTWMLVGLAARLAYCLQINVESTTGSPSKIESRRRMMWNLRILDRLLSGTVEEFSVCSKSVDKLRLPCNEYLFMTEIEAKTDTLSAFWGDQQVQNIGGFAALVGLFEIWREILLKLREANNLNPSIATEDTNDISSLLASNIAFLDGLADRVPRIAAIQREIRKIISKDAAHPSAENIIDAGLPLIRRHSRQELIEQCQHGYREADEHPEPAPSPNSLDKAIRSTNMEEGEALADRSPARLSEMPDFYIRTPLSLEGGGLTIGRTARHPPKPGHIRWGQDVEWRGIDSEQQQCLRPAEPMDNYPFLGPYHDNSIEAMVGYIAPFEIVSQYDILAETWFTGNEEPRRTENFWTQF